MKAAGAERVERDTERERETERDVISPAEVHYGIHRDLSSLMSSLIFPMTACT